MRNVIEELYYGNIHPYDRAYEKSTVYLQAMKHKHANMNKLLATLNDAEKELFEKYNEAVEEAEEITRYDTFSYALKLGTRLAAEVFVSEEQDLQKI